MFPGMGTSMDVTPGGMERTEPAKRKRGRPRKYIAPGTTQLVIQTPGTLPTASPQTPGTEKRPRGRPPGSSKKQQLVAPTAGIPGQAFTPHIIAVADGEDVGRKIMSFAQTRSRAVCVISANGAISNVTLRQQATSGGTVSYQGRYEILSLMGSFFPHDARGGNLPQTGGLSVSLACADGRVIGGSVAGLLLAASPLQVVVGSFASEPPAPSQLLSGNGQGPSLGLSPIAMPLAPNPASATHRAPKNE
ncbi:hypothetical protein BDL97_03G064500 [Sphagnum fallax]|nr:hypothetical protein BDL97_03G064500 [Sphagnum fallax]KAH8967159.1 hypothetical protein BDL97_03G064500 [Sphagnum fallax]KAH8967160.1 hypothetical protein BDL97_03G064500 [Sphagnum fallax]KAH8967161.1 hypothetical protein BDL97_03G064500 [Sphagnum fallax]